MTPAESAEPKPATEPFAAAPLEMVDDSRAGETTETKDLQMLQEVEK